jgi:hypothetical protein
MATEEVPSTVPVAPVAETTHHNGVHNGVGGEDTIDSEKLVATQTFRDRVS